MLYLTRNARQAIVIDGKIRIVVRALKDGRVRVGIEAPPEVAVEREEIATLSQAGTPAQTYLQDDMGVDDGVEFCCSTRRSIKKVKSIP